MNQAAITCLLVDDDVDEHEIFQLALDTLKHDAELRSVTDAQMALQQLSDRTMPLPDYIFIDLNMPRLDGRELLRMIKQQGAAKDIPVIIYSTSSSQHDIDVCIAAGAARFMTKPGTLSELKELLNNIFERV